VIPLNSPMHHHGAAESSHMECGQWIGMRASLFSSKDYKWIHSSSISGEYISWAMAEETITATLLLLLLQALIRTPLDKLCLFWISHWRIFRHVEKVLGKEADPAIQEHAQKLCVRLSLVAHWGTDCMDVRLAGEFIPGIGRSRPCMLHEQSALCNLVRTLNPACERRSCAVLYVRRTCRSAGRRSGGGKTCPDPGRRPGGRAGRPRAGPSSGGGGAPRRGCRSRAQAGPVA